MMPNANIKEIVVLNVMPSPLNIQVNNVNTMIPMLNDMNLLGQKAPWNPSTK